MLQQKKEKLTKKRLDALTDAYNALNKLTLFKDLTDEELWSFCSVVEFEKYRNKDVIAYEGDINSKLYIVTDGKVIVSKKTALGEPYVISIIDSSAKKEIFLGEVSLVDEHVRTATITALGDVSLYSITGDVFATFCDSNPQMGYKILKLLVRSICKHLRRANNDVITLFNALVEETKRSIEEDSPND